MKIYMHTDLEGVTGLDQAEKADRSQEETYRETCANLMLDVNAAVDGAFAGGATHVAVADGHGGQLNHNFILDMLDERTTLDERTNKKWWGMLDESYDGVFFVGAHAMAGTQNGFLDHTQSSVHIYNWIVNGRKIGELGQFALCAGAFGVPIIMVSGDEAGCAEARAYFEPVETAAVKQGVGRSRAIAYPPDEARARIREAARKALALVGQAKPFVPLSPKEIVIEYTRSDYADAAARREGVERLDARSVRMVSSDPFVYG